MNSIQSVFAAYVIGWAVFFIFYVSVARRVSSLHKEIEQLKSSLNRGK